MFLRPEIFFRKSWMFFVCFIQLSIATGFRTNGRVHCGEILFGKIQNEVAVSISLPGRFVLYQSCNVQKMAASASDAHSRVS